MKSRRAGFKHITLQLALLFLLVFRSLHGRLHFAWTFYETKTTIVARSFITKPAMLLYELISRIFALLLSILFLHVVT